MATKTDTKKQHKLRLPILSLGLRGAKRNQAEVPETVSESCSPSKLLELPSELLMDIFSFLDLVDLSALTATNRALNEILAGPGSDITRYFISSCIPHSLAPKPRDTQYWRHILRTTRRWNNIAYAAEEIKSFIQYRTLLYHNAQRNVRVASVARQIGGAMMPPLFNISVYLSQVKELIIQHGSDSKDCQARVIDYTVEFLTSMPLDSLLTLHYTWLFLQWLLKTLICRPSYAGSIERTIRGWTADPLDQASLTRILIFGNMPAVKKLIRLRDYNERRKWALSFLNALDPESTVKWADNWAMLETGLDMVPSESQARQALNINLPIHDLWIEGAASVFRTEAEHELADDERTPTASNTVIWLGRLAGFDIFSQTAPRQNSITIDNDDASSASSLRSFHINRTRTGSIIDNPMPPATMT